MCGPSAYRAEVYSCPRTLPVPSLSPLCHCSDTPPAGHRANPMPVAAAPLHADRKGRQQQRPRIGPAPGRSERGGSVTRVKGSVGVRSRWGRRKQEEAAWLPRRVLRLPTPHFPHFHTTHRCELGLQCRPPPPQLFPHFHTMKPPTAASSACSAACPSSAARARCCEPAASACRGRRGGVTEGIERVPCGVSRAGESHACLLPETPLPPHLQHRMRLLELLQRLPEGCRRHTCLPRRPPLLRQAAVGGLGTALECTQ